MTLSILKKRNFRNYFLADVISQSPLMALASS